jgi:adenylate cyclase
MAGVGLLRRGGINQLQKQQIQRLLGQTTSPEVALELWNQRDSLLQDGRFKGQQMIATVLFSDTRDFTRISEQLTPTEVLTWLNRGMSSLIQEITTREGIINKFTGDGILAVFGAPLSQGVERDADNAITAALAIQIAIQSLNHELAIEGAPPMQIRIGIHTGPVIAGSLGSSERLEYTVIGDTVNCASRLESMAKEQQSNDCRILVSRQTMEACQSGTYPWHKFGRIRVKGREEFLDVIELNPNPKNTP